MRNGGERARLLAKDGDSAERGGSAGVTNATNSELTAWTRRTSVRSVVSVLVGLALFALAVVTTPSWNAARAVAALGDASQVASDEDQPLALGTFAPKKLQVPIYMMGDSKPGSEDNRLLALGYTWLREALGRRVEMNDDDFQKTVFFQQATFPTRWHLGTPDSTIDVAKEAVRYLIEDDPAHERLNRINWLKGVFSRTKEECEALCDFLAHHVGCLLTHMRVWDRFLKSGADKFVMWESDGFTLNSIHPLDYNMLAHQLPEEADLVWMKPDLLATGQFVKKFKSHGTNAWPTDARFQLSQLITTTGTDVYLYKFNHRCDWAGTPSYMMTRKGAAKIMNFIKNAEQADMIDAWLSHHCTTRCEDPKVCMNLNCYNAQSAPVPRELLGGYIPDWYDEQDDSFMREVDSEIIKTMDDAHAYNSAGCGRSQSFIPWLPIGFTGQWGIEDINSVRDCVHGAGVSQYKGCSPKFQLPINGDLPPQKIEDSASLGHGELIQDVPSENVSQKRIIGHYEQGLLDRVASLSSGRRSSGVEL
jgi:hypothetical protein